MKVEAAFALVFVILTVACSGDPETRKQAYFENGNQYFGQAKLLEASIEYRNALQIDPRFAAARVKLAESQFGV